MGQAVGRLYEIQGLDPADPLLHFGVMLMEVPNNQDMVMSIPTEQGIIGWLQARNRTREGMGVSLLRVCCAIKEFGFKSARDITLENLFNFS